MQRLLEHSMQRPQHIPKPRPPSPFLRELLPAPASFYQDELGKLGRPSRGWAWAPCPFHPDHHPSLHVHLHSGAFRCFSCGAAGGDVIAFLMLRDKLSFQAAARALGAWDDEPNQNRKAKLKRIVVGQDLVLAFSIARLAEIGRGAGERYAGEAETCWGIMADLLPQIRAFEQVRA